MFFMTILKKINGTCTAHFVDHFLEETGANKQILLIDSYKFRGCTTLS